MGEKNTNYGRQEEEREDRNEEKSTRSSHLLRAIQDAQIAIPNYSRLLLRLERDGQIVWKKTGAAFSAAAVASLPSFPAM